MLVVVYLMTNPAWRSGFERLHATADALLRKRDYLGLSRFQSARRKQSTGRAEVLDFTDQKPNADFPASS